MCVCASYPRPVHCTRSVHNNIAFLIRRSNEKNADKSANGYLAHYSASGQGMEIVKLLLTPCSGLEGGLFQINLRLTYVVHPMSSLQGGNITCNIVKQIVVEWSRSMY